MAKFIPGKTSIFKAAVTMPDVAWKITPLAEALSSEYTNVNIRVVYQSDIGGFGAKEHACKVIDVSTVSLVIVMVIES